MGGNNLGGFQPTTAAANQAGTARSYTDLGLTGAGFGGAPGVPTTAELTDFGNEQLFTNAQNFQNAQQFAMALNSANTPKNSSGQASNTGTGGFPTGFNNQGGSSDVTTA